jgi:hypothetical protein
MAQQPSMRIRGRTLGRRFMPSRPQVPDGHVAFSEERKEQWVAVIEMEREEIQNANASAEQTF